MNRCTSLASMTRARPLGETADPREHFMAGSYALHLLELTERWGVTSEEFFKGLGLRQLDLEAPESRLPISVLIELIRRARLLTGEPALGILFGLQTRTNFYGYLT